ncbi:plasmid pRiA4b ORF-3 family protein [Cupriavidus plantarum]|uniref:plasmid pRiA4b ORF-3 family protein n=1 Tax=Cupriavidus plantarum TaxID=942865 RepID=UPI00339D71B8
MRASATLRIELQGIHPPVWRRFVVPAEILLPKLHKVIQAVMGWENYHLHQFRFGTAIFGTPSEEFLEDPTRSEKGVRLVNALGTATDFVYEYDFGDGWEHYIHVEAMGESEEVLALPVCTAGENACPPEDVGGAGGYEDFKKALAQPGNPHHAEYRKWIGGVFDPAGFDVNAVNFRLRRLR